MTTWLYRFDQFDDALASVGGDMDRLRGLLGGKGANLAEMTSLGVPVPPGFTITTDACNAWTDAGRTFPDGLWEQVLDAISVMEAQTGRAFGDPDRPLLLACRSGAKFSMPGMMDTVLDIGLDAAAAEGLAAESGSERFVLDSRRRLLQMFGSVVLGVHDDAFQSILGAARSAAGVATDAELDAARLASVVAGFEDVIARRSATAFPEDPHVQLHMAIEAVFASWHGRRAHDYREASGIPHDLGTAVNVVAMVFGNLGEDSATGVAMSRDATTGERRLEGDYLVNAQGEDVVAGIRETLPIARLAEAMPEVAAEFAAIAERLESHYRDMQDMEFTVEDGKLWMLQTRTGKRTAQAAVRIAVEMVDEGLIGRDEAIARITPDHIDAFLHPRFDREEEDARTPIASGLNVSPGAAVGVAAFDPDLAQRWAAEGRAVVLVRPETKPDDVHGLLAARGVLTSSGGRTSHAALVARQFGKPAVVGASAVDIDVDARVLRVGDIAVAEGDWLSIDGTTGDVYEGQIPTRDPDLDNPWLVTLLGWADEVAELTVRANADDPVEAARARGFGATGIGLCRTEHMFFDPQRLPIVQRMIMATTQGERRDAVDALLPLQRSDFAGLFRAMDGLPVVIRLLDPPLHEFLPDHDDLTRRTADLQIRLRSATDLVHVEALVDELVQVRSLLERVEALRETNPMLGLRGVRLGLRIPELTRMQARAVGEAAIEVRHAGVDARPEIMVPLVAMAGEMATAQALIEDELAAVAHETGESLDIAIGTMIELPRAALTAAEIARHAAFFSFGTNDLTQTTLGISRDDAEAKFLRRYLTEGVIESNPFATIDVDGVGRLMAIAVEEGRAARAGLEVGICGEHGGEPASIALCHRLGLDYVSCSAYRVPVARLAAAHATLAVRR